GDPCTVDRRRAARRAPRGFGRPRRRAISGAASDPTAGACASGAMTEIDFYRLPREIQDGLLDALRGQLMPAPILTRPGTRQAVLGWIAVSGAAALALM